MAKDYIGYESLTDQALRSVVREALRRVTKQGLIGSHHFYLTFKTHDPGVEIPEFLKERYPDEITIVLQNQFSGLKVTDDAFEVTLTFQKLPATLYVPFTAMTAFADPGVQFGLQFRNATAAQQPGAAAPQPDAAKKDTSASSPIALPAASAKDKAAEPEPKPEQPEPPSGPQVVSLDKFRKK